MLLNLFRCILLFEMRHGVILSVGEHACEVNFARGVVPRFSAAAILGKYNFGDRCDPKCNLGTSCGNISPGNLFGGHVTYDL